MSTVSPLTLRSDNRNLISSPDDSLRLRADYYSSVAKLWHPRAAETRVSRARLERQSGYSIESYRCFAQQSPPLMESSI